MRKSMSSVGLRTAAVLVCVLGGATRASADVTIQEFSGRLIAQRQGESPVTKGQVDDPAVSGWADSASAGGASCTHDTTVVNTSAGFTLKSEGTTRSGAGSQSYAESGLVVRFTVPANAVFSMNGTVNVTGTSADTSVQVWLATGQGADVFRFDIPGGNAFAAQSGTLSGGSYALRLSSSSEAGTGADESSSYNVTLSVVPTQASGAAVRWVRASGGQFSSAANWDPQQVPGSADIAVFDLPATYTVTVGARQTDQLKIRRGRLTFVSGDYNVTSLTRALDVTGGSTLSLEQGMVLRGHRAVIGETGSAGRSQVNVSDVGTFWGLNDLLEIGSSGDGFLAIAAGGVATLTTRIGSVGGRGFVALTAGGFLASDESLVGTGGFGTGGTGGVTVTDSPSQWFTGNVAIGFTNQGSLTVVGGGTVASDEASVAYDVLEPEPSVVIVDGTNSAGAPSKWTARSLTVGRQGSGIVVVQGGAEVRVAQDVSVGTQPGGAGFVVVEGSASAEPGADSLLVVDASLRVGDGGQGALFVRDGGAVNVLGPILLGRGGGDGRATVSGVGLFDASRPATLVGDGDLVVGGDGGTGTLIVDSGGYVPCKTAYVGFYGTGTVALHGDAAKPEDTSVHVTGDLAVGGAATQGLLRVDDATVGVDGDILISPLGRMQGVNGKLVVGGTVFVEPAGILEAPLRGGNQVVDVPAKNAKPAPASPAVLTVDGNLDVKGIVVVHAAGPAPGTQAARLIVTGDAHIGGKLIVQFMNGFAPKQGDQFDLVQVTGARTGDFAEVDVRGLEPGAQFQTAFTGGALAVTAMNDSVALPTVSVKAIGKKLTEKRRRSGGFTVSRKGSTASALVVQIAIGGSAGNGADYGLVATTVTIPARKRSAKLKVSPVLDSVAEEPESLEVEIVAGTAYTHSLASRASLTITDR